MEVLLTRMGKAWSVLRRDGVVRGMKRIVASGLALFRPVSPGDVLFVTGGAGDSAQYRCHHVAESLRLRSIAASVTVQDNPFLLSYAEQRFSVFVFHRVMETPKMRAFVDRLKALGKEIVFETDDLTFDAERFSETDAYARMGTLERKLYEDGLGRWLLDDPYVKVATTSTAYLADRLRDRGKQVLVVPNMLSEEDVKGADIINKQRTGNREQGVENSERRTGTVLGYFSGSASHDRDFATITNPLSTLLEKYSSVSLVIYGPLNLPAQFELFQERIVRKPYTARRDHFANVAAIDINLAPLVVGDPFCESKSELKFFEAGIVGVPTVATATQTFCEAMRNGEDGYVAKTEAEWLSALERLVTDTDLRKQMGNAAYETASSRYTTKNVPDDYVQYLRSKIPVVVE